MRNAHDPRSVPVFGSGELLGLPERSQKTSGFSMTRRRASVPSAQVPTHSHAEAHFVLVLAGNYCSSARGAGEGDGAGTLIFNPPAVTHRDRFLADGGRFFSLGIAAERYRETEAQLRLPGDAVRLLSSAAVGLARRLSQEIDSWDATSNLVCEGLALQLLGELCREREPSGAPPWIEQARQMLEESAARDWSITDVARAVGVHPVHLARCFRRSQGCSPGEYARKRRLERAARRLLSSAAPLAEIALEVGFADQSHFSKAFRRAYGTTPASFREECRPGQVSL